MKKIYITPVSEIVEMSVMPVMSTASYLTAPEEGDDVGRGSDIYQSDEFRGDWSNIWENMQ